METMGMIIVLLIAVAGGIFAYSYYRNRSGRRLFPQSEDEALEIAKRRYANGEISREEFERIKGDLEDEGRLL
jgi:putative membrane protein